MDTSIEWSPKAILTRRNDFVFYSHFVSTTNVSQTYSCGDIATVKIDKKVLLAEITHIWLTSGSTKDGHVRLRLYSRPDDLPHGRTHYHGEHELLVFHKPAILTCTKFLSIEYKDAQWSLGLSLQPSPPQPLSSSGGSVPPSPISSTSSSTTALLYCNEPMIPVGGFQDHTGVSPVTSPVLVRTSSTSISSTSCTNGSCHKLRILSFPSYCRYRAVLKRFEPNCYEYMDLPLVQAMGGIPVPSVHTMVLFCRKTFRDISLERKIMVLEGLLTLGDIRNEEQLIASDGSCLLPLKRKRGRPRKTEQQLQPLPKDNHDVVKRRRGRPRKTPLNETTSRFIDRTKTVNNDLLIHENRPTIKQEPSPSTISIPTSINNHSTTVVSTTGTATTCTATGTATGTTTGTATATGTSGTIFDGILETEDSRLLRPRSTLLPPPQYRDNSVYDMNIDNSTAPLIKKPPTIAAAIVPSPVVMSNEVKQHVIKPAIVSRQVPSTSATVTPAVTISPDVRQLLRAHLSRLQEAPPNGPAWSKTLLASLEDHLLEEKAFLDLLFCFMKLRNTPIHRVPRLGSKYLNLYDLFKSTAQLGGYDQVTLNRKWSSVFDCMGCSSGMTCASTVTRKHYEKLLLPFEKALTAMKQTSKQAAAARNIK